MISNQILQETLDGISTITKVDLVVTDADGKVKHQSTCYRLFILFICGDYCLTTGLLDRSKKFGFSIVFMTPSLRVTSMIPAKAEGNVLLREKKLQLM